MGFLRRHLLAVVVAALGAISFAIFTWSEYGYFCDQNSDHNEILQQVHGRPQACPSFWSSEHIHDWVYNAASNWQSELIFGVLLIVVLHGLAGRKDEDQT
jgi:hypothetical protein